MAATRERAGRPTQIHGVTLEERAYDASGQRLPWGYRWPDDHPNARFQKSPPEEKGAFGKSSRRFGSSRATRTQTPAKRENPTLDGFEAALKFDASKNKDDGQTSRQQSSSETNQPLTSGVKEPMQVMLYGFSSDFQWGAIDFYERVSGGMICEDYPREPPAEKRRFHSGLSGGSIPRRALTSSELQLSSQYHGGASWIVVTFDSHESAERAIHNSPHLIQGFWVYAEPYRGVGPADDAPVPAEKGENKQDGSLAPPKPPPKSATLGPSTSSAGRRESSSTQKPGTTLPRSYLLPAGQAFQGPNAADTLSTTSTTASSATALAADDSPNIGSSLRHRSNAPSSSTLSPDRNDNHSSTATALAPKVEQTRQTFTHFPDVPKTIIKPANEALLPQPSLWESVKSTLRKNGLIPGDMVGDTMPRKEDGSFDLERASLYWRCWYWLDWTFGTDFLGVRDEGGL